MYIWFRMTRVPFLISLLLLSFVAKAQVDLLSMSFPEQCRTLDSIEGAILKKDKSATLNDIYQHYIKEAISQDNDELEMQVQIRSLYRAANIKEVSEKRFLSGLETSINKCKKNKWKHLAAFGYEYYLKYWSRQNLRAEEIKYGLKAYNEYKDLSDTFYIYKKQRLHNLANLYLGFDEQENALKFFHLAREASQGFNLSVINGIALIHMNNEHYDSALYYFDVLYDSSVKKGNQVYSYLAKANSIGIYMRRKQYDTAMVLLKASIPKTEKPIYKKFIAGSYERMGYIYLQKNNSREANKCMNIALEKFREVDSNWYYKFTKQGYHVFKTIAEIKAALKNHKQAYRYLDSALLVKDSLDKKYNIVKLKDFEQDLAKSKLNFANQRLQFEQKQVKLQRNLLIVTIIAAAFILLFIIYRYRAHREKLKLEKDKAESELLSSKDKLSDFTKSIQEKNKLIESFEQKLSKYNPASETAEYTESISELRDSTILTDDEWEDFRKTFEKVHVGFLIRLKELYPKLTPAEIRYMVLSKLDMNTKEMASILGVNSSSIRTLKSRLIKKLGITNEEELKNIVGSV